MNYLSKQELTAKYCYNSMMAKKGGSDTDRLGNTLFNSKIALTPHQIQAALFAFKSPLSKGVILADEVGLGKTIEAGIVISQTWYEKAGKILIVAPASLQRQWQNEMYEKFGLQSAIIDRRNYNQKLKQGYPNPILGFDERILICSYQMCSAFKEDIRNSGFSLVVIDEAHKLRNVHNEKSITANNIKFAIEKYKKVLLTATPIQNNLLDLYGISSIIDDELFGDKSVFRENYIKNYSENAEFLEQRLKRVLHRTLRNQVQQYIQFTNRIPKTFLFEQTVQEQEVYLKIKKLINYANDDSYLIPKGQRHLLLLILCKLMGSSMHSIVFTLSKMLERLESIKATGESLAVCAEDYGFDIDELDNDQEFDIQDQIINADLLEYEIREVETIIRLASSIDTESKYLALKDSLDYSFEHLKKLGAAEKVIIFTESRRTQDYLYQSLINDGYKNVFTFNGSNTDERAKEIYNEWIARDENAEKVQESKSVNIRTAILDKFRECGNILIATEAGAEGLNLQFCSLVINYDLPWNPQRVEQRIGRCHRFGQKYDVVVINFISSNNVVEQRIYELLSSKFRLFNEILGSSDAILGAIEDGKNLEKAIVEIYVNCRNEEEINAAFDKLQEEFKSDIESSISKAKEDLLKNFEEDLQQLFTDMMVSTENSISKIEKLVCRIIKALWGEKVRFLNPYSFIMGGHKYCLSSKNEDSTCIDFNFNSQKGKELERECQEISRKEGTIVFDISNYPYRLSNVEKLKGESGFLTVAKLTIESFEKEEHLVCNGIMCNGERIDSETCEILFRLDTEEREEKPKNIEVERLLELDLDQNIKAIINTSQIRNNQYLAGEIEKINAWTDDKIQAVQMEVEQMRSQRKILQQQSDYASNLKEKEEIEEEILILSKKIRKSWIDLAMAEEELEEERKNMIDAIKKENMKNTTVEKLFVAYFEVQ